MLDITMGEKEMQLHLSFRLGLRCDRPSTSASLRSASAQGGGLRRYEGEADICIFWADELESF